MLERTISPMQPGSEEVLGRPRYDIRAYTPDEAPLIYKELEVPNWAPWLRASVETLTRRAEVFPEGQLAIWTPEGDPIASLSLSRFQYNGDPYTLPTWDALMGDPPTGEGTFDLKGNAVGMMSINVRQDYQGGGLSRVIIDTVKQKAPAGVEHIMGSFRPSQFGEYAGKYPHISFSEYVGLLRPDNMPLDAWLRALARNGMRQLRIDDYAMVVPDVPRETFDEYRATYNPGRWRQISPTVWRCGETGIWIAGDKTATYAESNVWGILDQNGNGNGLQSPQTA